MKSSIDVLANYKKRKVAILADMLELGSYSQQLHEEVGNYVATKEIDVLICSICIKKQKKKWRMFIILLLIKKLLNN